MGCPCQVTYKKVSKLYRKHKSNCSIYTKNIIYEDVNTLFESYITYGITVWGSIPNRKFNKLFNAQKKILRVLFGDREKFLDKFRTCIRARPYPEQNLPTEFYVKEHSKPLFNSLHVGKGIFLS